MSVPSAEPRLRLVVERRLESTQRGLPRLQAERCSGVSTVVSSLPSCSTGLPGSSRTLCTLLTGHEVPPMVVIRGTAGCSVNSCGSSLLVSELIIDNSLPFSTISSDTTYTVNVLRSGISAFTNANPANKMARHALKQNIPFFDDFYNINCKFQISNNKLQINPRLEIQNTSVRYENRGYKYSVEKRCGS